MTLLVAACALLVATAAIAMVLRGRERRSPAERKGWPIGHTVVVQTSELSVRGILVEVYADTLQLTNPAFLDAPQPEGLAGDVFLPRPKVSLCQRLPAAEVAAQ